MSSAVLTTLKGEERRMLPPLVLLPLPLPPLRSDDALCVLSELRVLREYLLLDERREPRPLPSPP